MRFDSGFWSNETITRLGRLNVRYTMAVRTNTPTIAADDRTKAIAESSLERLFRRTDVGVREKCLWRLLYETAARAEEVLSADVGDLDLENKRLRVRRKGGDADWLHFQSGSARLLPRLIGDRRAGPIFLAERRPLSGPHAGSGRPLPRHRTGPALLRAGRVPLQAELAQGRQQGLDSSPTAAFRPHPPGRRRRQPAAADGKEWPPEPPVAATIRSARIGSCRGH